MEQPETPVAERVARRGPLDDSPALRRACADVAEEEEDLVRRLKRVREDRAHLDQIAEEEKRKKQRRAMPGGVRAPKGPTDDYEESSDDEEEEDPPPPPSRRKRDAPSPSGDGAEAPVKHRRRIIEESSDEDEEVAEAPRSSEPVLPSWPSAPRTAAAALAALARGIKDSRVGRTVMFLAANASGDVAEHDCPVEVAVAFDARRRFSTLLAHTVDPSDAAVRKHGLSAQKLRDLNAPTPKEGLSRMLEFISKHDKGQDLIIVGHDELCSHTVPMLAAALRECNLPTTVLEESSFLEVASIVPDEVVGDEEGLDLSRNDLYEALFRENVPDRASRADVSNYVSLMLLAGSLETMGMTFDAVAVAARLPDAVPGLLLEEAEVSSSEEEAPALSTTRFEGACWRGRPRTRGAQWVYARRAEDLGDAWDISSASISKLAGVTKSKPSKAVAEKYEVQRLRELTHKEISATGNDQRRDAAFHERRDGGRRTRDGWRTLARDRRSMREALKRLYADQMLYAKLGRAPTVKEATKWFKEFYTNPPCACNGRAKACKTKCTTCDDCVNKRGGGVFEHTEALLSEVSKIPGDIAFLARMRASDASGDAKYLVAWHRPCTQCNRCNKDGLVAFVDRAKLSKVAGAEARSKAAERKADELEALFGYGS